MNIKNVYIVEPVSQYGALNYFNKQIAQGFKACGVNACISSTYELDEDGHIMGLSDSDLVVAFNGACSGDFLNALIKGGIPYWSFFVDHPYYHYSRLGKCGNNQIVSVIDRKHLDYLEKYYPRIKHKIFMPHGGAEAEMEVIPFADKKYDVVFLGTYQKPEVCLEGMKEYDADMQALFWQIVDNVRNGKENTLEDSVQSVFEEYGLLEGQESIAAIMPKLCFLDMYLRYKRRDLLIRAALDSGTEIHVFGKGWDAFEGYEGNNLIIHDGVSYEDSLKIMADAKIVLNNMPLFADGSHERVFSVLASGSICLTDSNPYLCENFTDKADLFYYHWSNMQLVPEIIKDILAKKYDVEQIIQNGHVKVIENHMWMNRAKEILEYCQGVTLMEEKHKIEKEKMKVKEVLDLMEKILSFVVDNMEQMNQNELKQLFDNITGTFFTVNEELFQSRELIKFRTACIRTNGQYEDGKKVIAFFQEWHDFIINLLHEKEALSNMVDEEFKTLMDYVKYVDKDRILLNAKKDLMLQSADYVKRINAYYHKFNYLWGDMDIFNDVWDVLESRVNSLTEHWEDLEWLYSKLEDYRSKFVLLSMLSSWIHFDPSYITRMKEGNFKDYFDLDILRCDENEVMVDLGAFIGDSAMDYIRTYRKYKKIYCYEISGDSIEKMRENLKDYANIEILQKGVGRQKAYMYVNKMGTNDASGNMLGEEGSDKIEVVSLDEDIQEPVTLIKMDIEGAEQDALKGSIRHIREERPKLLICVYHNNKDIFEIPKWLHQVRKDYKFYLRSNGLQYGPSEIVLFAV